MQSKNLAKLILKKIKYSLENNKSGDNNIFLNGNLKGILKNPKLIKLRPTLLEDPY